MRNTSSISTQVWLFVVSTSLVFLILCSQLGGRLGLFLGLLIALTFHTLIFLWGEGFLLKNFTLSPLKGQDPWRLNDKLDQWTVENKQEKPRLFLMSCSLPTAFSFELPWKHSMIVLSEGLLKTMSHEEVEMVLAHQLCQLRHRRNLRFAVLSLLANTFSQLAVKLDKFWIPNYVFGRKQKPFLYAFSPVISALVRLSHSTTDQFAADQNAAQLIGSREKLGRLLWKLEGWALTHPIDVPPATSQLFIVNPERIRQKNHLLQFHPPTQSRLEKLVGSYPI